jgi:hypothetical protein
MDLPVHLAAGACIGSAVLYVEHKTHHPVSPRRDIKIGLIVFVISVLSHLLLDAVPHYDWLFYVTIFKPLPYYWLLPQVIMALPVILLALTLTRDRPVIVVASLAGAVYPDVEKLAYLDFGLPKALVLFPHHSCSLSQWTPWELAHKDFLIILEMAVMTVCLVGVYRFTLKRRGALFGAAKARAYF